MVPVCDKRYHIYNRFRHFWAEIKKLWNYPLDFEFRWLALNPLFWLISGKLTIFFYVLLVKNGTFEVT